MVQSARNDLLKNEHQKLMSDNARLIKVNKSKKIIDTARRSRIQQLDKNSYNTEAPIASSATNKSTKNK